MDLLSFNGAAGGYIVMYKSEHESDWHNISVSNPMRRFHILDRLAAYTTYRVHLVSNNSEYESEKSEVATSKTIESGERRVISIPQQNVAVIETSVYCVYYNCLICGLLTFHAPW